MAAELARLKVDVIVAGGSGDIRAAKEASATIPIVMINGGDAVGSGFVASLARPGGNVTGLATLRPELSGKRLELLKEIVPGLSRVAVFVSSNSADHGQLLKELDLAAGALGVKLQSLDIQSPKDFESAFRDAAKGRAEAVLVRVPGPIISAHRTKVATTRGKKPAPGNIRKCRRSGSRGAYELRLELSRLVPARRRLCGQNFERREACRSAGGAADEIRVHDQSQERPSRSA